MTKMWKKQSRTMARMIVILLAMSMCLCGCAKTSNPAGSSEETKQSIQATSSSEESKKVEDKAEESKTDESKEENNSDAGQDSSKEESTDDKKEETGDTTEEKPAPSGEYLKEMVINDVYEFTLSEYNSDFVVGDTVRIEVEMESDGGFNGSLGTCIGQAYVWQQEEFSTEETTYTLSWKVMPSVDMAQLGIWHVAGTKLGVKSIKVTIEEPEIGIKGDYVKTLMMGDNYEIKLSDYNPDYKVGDLVTISVNFESDGDFNGCLGASIGSKYEWKQKEITFAEAGSNTAKWTVKPSTDMVQVGIWWVGGTAVGIESVNVTIEEEEIGITGDYMEIYTDPGVYEFPITAIHPWYKVGDTIEVIVQLESDGDVQGCLGTSVGWDYQWKQLECQSEEPGCSTWIWQGIVPSSNYFQVGFWWIGGSAVGIKSIDVHIMEFSKYHDVVAGGIYTASKSGETYTFLPADYCEFEDGDTITIEVDLESNDVYNGRIYVVDPADTTNTPKVQTKFEKSNGGGTTCSIVLKANKTDEAKLDFWWMNTQVAINDIRVTKGGEVKVDEPGIFTIIGGEQYFDALNYATYEEGDTLKVEATFTGDGAFNGQIGMAGSSWCQKDFTMESEGTITVSMEVPGAYVTNDDIKVAMYWIGGSKVTLDELKVTVISKAEDDGGDDGGDDIKPAGPSDGDSDDDDFEGTLIFRGELGEGYNATDMSWLLNAAENDVITIKFSSVAGKEGWGVLCWGATVDGGWIDGNTVPSLVYSADGSDATKEVVKTTTAGELRNALGIAENSEVTALMLAIWNDAKIIELSIKSGNGSGNDKPDDGGEVDEGIIIFKDDTLDSYETSSPAWLVNAKDEAVITIVYTCTDATHAGWGILGWGASIEGEDWKNGPSYSADGADATKEVKTTITAAELKEALGITEESVVTYLKLGAWNGGKLISLSMKE